MLNAILIDDEANAREKLGFMLEQYCAASVKLVAQARNVEEGLAAIAAHRPQLVFLDVEMPGESGFDLLRRVGRPEFEVVFTTAHDHYAIKAIKFAAVDYLLKPIDVDQLREAIARVVEKRAGASQDCRIEQLVESTRQGAQVSSVSVPSQDGFVRVKLTDIIWCGAERYFTIFHLTGGKELVATRSLGDFEELLDGSGFVRIHHGHLVSLEHIARYIKGEGGQVVMSDGRTLDVSRRKKEELMKRLGK
ncbi:MAG: response regulator transcription factor [Flavobacteriales bacterium]|nr:response regulator transcription factor [Flavobacteriales bacterium]MBK7943450.1 response regulator transcription factor [Flavobacteriales bacterium]